MKRRNLKLSVHRKVEVSRYSARLTVNLGGYTGATEIRAKAELDPSDAAMLIVELRRGLHELRKYIDDQIQYAEGRL